MPITATVVREKTAAGEVDFTVHAIFEAAEDLIFVDEAEDALLSGEIIENDTERSRCLVCGRTRAGGLVHVVIDYLDWLTDPRSHVVAVTVYRPDPNRWIDGRLRKV